MPPGANLGKPGVFVNAIPSDFWLQPVKVNSRDADQVGESLTINIRDYLNESKLFNQAKTYRKAAIKENDLVGEIEFSSYQIKRSIHPAYFPAALLTATVYIWVGGPIAIDTVNLVATLVVKDASGKEIARAKEEIKSKQNKSFYQPFAGGVKERTNVINKLFERISNELSTKK